jgi:hypothetical protein
LVSQCLRAAALRIERFEPSCLICFSLALALLALGCRHRKDTTRSHVSEPICS